MTKIVGIDKDIKTTDKIKFVLNTFDSSGCDILPYKVDKITIYFITREFTSNQVSEYKQDIIDSDLKKSYEEAKQTACQNPIFENLNKLNILKQKIENSKYTTPFYFKDAIPIKTFGGYEEPENDGVGRRFISEKEFFPAWLNPEFVDNDIREKVIRDNILEIYEENDEQQLGKFVLDWDPSGCREGDYFICWNWTPNLAGDSISSYQMFYLNHDTRSTSAMPIHRTKPEKYETLLDRYLPSMFKSVLSDSDLSPFVLQELNYSVAKGFTFIEDFVNQIIELLDANSTQEQMLPLLSNLFNLRLKSNDPTRWRKQTKKAIKNFKKKGTISGLKSALSDAGFLLNKFTKLWQVKSKYTYQEHFEKSNSNVFALSKNIIEPIDENHFELFIRKKNNKIWEKIDSSYVQVTKEENKYFATWIDGEILLEEGDLLRILYQFNEIPIEEENLELYIRSLPLMDLRDEKDQKYPPKNWNTKVLDEEDPLFDLIIKKKHPIKDLIIWGKVRTEFPYSENIYNMEEYNGSTRDSLNACDIDKEFIDPCEDCQASVFSIDVGIEELSEDRIEECRKTIEEFVPFHSLVHNISFSGSQNEFIKSPLEEINILVRYSIEDLVLSGDAQKIFNRSLPSDKFPEIKRNLLSQINNVTGSDFASGTGYNNSIVLFAPGFTDILDLEDNRFKNKTNRPHNYKINTSSVSSNVLSNSNLLEILSPSSNAGLYSISSYSRGYFELFDSQNINQPLDRSQFEFRVSNKIYETSTNIEQSDTFIFSSKFDFTKVTIKTKKNEENPDKLRIIGNNVSFEYEILDILPDNKLLIAGPSNSNLYTLSKNNINWQINTEFGTFSGADGVFTIKKMGKIILNSDKVKIGDYILHNNSQYKIKSSKQNEFYIENYQGGNVGGIQVVVYRRIIENCVGQLDYNGLILDTVVDYEDLFKIQNGENQLEIATRPTNFKENYLIFIDSNYYSILKIDKNFMYLAGPNKDWTTLGTAVDFTIYRFINLPVNIYSNDSEYSFGEILRKNNNIIEKTTIFDDEFPISMIAGDILNKLNSSSEIIESSAQTEKIKINIEYKDGNIEEKEI